MRRASFYSERGSPETTRRASQLAQQPRRSQHHGRLWICRPTLNAGAVALRARSTPAIKVSVVRFARNAPDTMPVEKTGALSPVGSVTYTSWDGYITETSYALDSAKPPMCWRTSVAGKGLSGECKGESAVNIASCKGTLTAYATTYKARVVGDAAGILAKLEAAGIADPIAILEAEKAAAQQAMYDADY